MKLTSRYFSYILIFAYDSYVRISRTPDKIFYTKRKTEVLTPLQGGIIMLSQALFKFEYILSATLWRKNHNVMVDIPVL